MIEGLINIVAPAGQAQAPEDASDETLDNVALAGAEAIQRIINDRNTLRSCTTAQQRDLATLNSVNQELRRRLGLIRHHYVELATRILTQLEQFDQATREATRDYVLTVEGDNESGSNASSKPADEGTPAAR